MNNSLFSHQSPSEDYWSSDEVVGQGRDWLDRLLGWWYKFTMPDRSMVNSSFAQREVERKSRLTSTIAFFYLLQLILSLPALTQLASVPRVAFLTTFVVIAAAAVVNRAGKTTIASIMLIFMYEAGLAITLLSYHPLDVVNFSTYDLFVVGELLAVTMLPVQSIFVIGLLNIVFIVVDMLFQPRSPELMLAMQHNGSMLMVIPITIQVLVACVVGLWVYSSSKANERANRAEMIMRLEHEMAEQRTVAEQEKLELEESIQQLVQAHVNTMNGQVQTRIPYPPAKALWPLVGVINSLWVRLQHTEQIERSQQQLKQAIASYTDFFHRASLSYQQPLTLKRTGTDLDPLVLSVKALQESWQRSNTAEPDSGH